MRSPTPGRPDRAGRPTTEPQAALDGFLLPIGGYKGYGLALVVDLFAGVLSGASYLTHVKSWIDEPGSPQDLGHFFLLIDAGPLGPPRRLAERLSDFAAILHGTPPADPARAVLLPGEIEMQRFERQQLDGIAIDAPIVALLEAYAARA